MATVFIYKWLLYCALYVRKGRLTLESALFVTVLNGQ